MHISIRRYKTPSSAEITRKVQEGFVPLISRAPGFVAYYGVESGKDSWASVSVFETQAQAEESNRLARDWARENKLDLNGPPEITAGEVTAHASKG